MENEIDSIDRPATGKVDHFGTPLFQGLVEIRVSKIGARDLASTVPLPLCQDIAWNLVPLTEELGYSRQIHFDNICPRYIF